MITLRTLRLSTQVPKVPAKLNQRNLYKYLLRQSARLPDPELQKYYKHHIRQSYIQHSDETEEERIQQIIHQAVKDIDWLLKKYKVIQ